MKTKLKEWGYACRRKRRMSDIDNMEDVSEAEDEQDESSSDAEMPEALAKNLPKRGTRGKRCGLSSRHRIIHRLTLRSVAE